MEARAQAAETLLAHANGRDALDFAIQAAELYMAAARDTLSKAEAARLRRKCRELILYAEKLKAQNQALSDDQMLILQRASHLHGNHFPPWNSDPPNTEFELPQGADLYTDQAAFTLSPTQVDNFAGWTRPADLFGLDSDRYSADDDLMMKLTGPCDLVQDITTDCSVVASLSAAAKVLLGRHAVLSTILFPFDCIKGQPRLSTSGKYIVRMNFNGCSRRVVVDDRLPASRSDRALFVIDRRHPYLLWPALLEKAYLKVRGGYDFPGSNSGTDLWVLMGWIPEQIFLQREDFDVNETWERIKAAHTSHDVVVTLGTGCISAQEEQLMGLIGEHDYAVEDIDSTHGGARKMLIKNPWRNAPLMAARRKRDSHGDCHNTAWMSLEDIAQHFESMYLNWNPNLFSSRLDRHFIWDMPSARLATSLVKNPQFTLCLPTGGSIWVLVSRHFVDAELDIARNRRDSMAAVARQLGFMSILVFDSQGRRVQISGRETYRGPYVDSPQTLARLQLSPGKRYTVVVDQHEFPLASYTFTMSLFSCARFQLDEAKEPMSHFQELLGSWSRRTAGGNPSCQTFYQNPQYKLSVSNTGPLSILIATDHEDAHVHVDLVWAQGERVTTVRVKDLISSSGEYRRGCAVADVSMLEPGVYTIVCSTFEAGQTAGFALRISSMAPVSMSPVPADGAGRLRTPLAVVRLAGEEKRRARLAASWLTRASVSINSVLSPGTDEAAKSVPALLMRISIVQGWGPERVTVAISGDGEFREPLRVLRTPDFDIDPAQIHDRDMWLVMECIGVHHTPYNVYSELLSDSPVQIGPWMVM
ncbi:hypothetical protein CDD81_4061 [Ophiocordyceps australis]|uniref:Calpain catalytic domain-containing protein n=1 Tax=Ophiocordyceps australis TaxID=1399860 RepID=A0A2C5XV49_9HYPO|nr:hypothetical protein CDD81_4061 [Ophiocordyceps australis]